MDHARLTAWSWNKPQTLGCRTGPADWGDPSSESDPYHPLRSIGLMIVILNEIFYLLGILQVRGGEISRWRRRYVSHSSFVVSKDWWFLGVVHGRTSLLFIYSTRGLCGLGMIGLVCTHPCLGLKIKLSMLGRCYLQIEENLEVSVRDWASDAGSVTGKDDGHVIGTSRLFCMHRLVLTPLPVDRFQWPHSQMPLLHPNQT